MKKKFGWLLCFLLLLVLPRAAYAEIITAEFDVWYGQTEARAILGMINAERSGKAEPLMYDADLEAYAMQRAAEIVVLRSHTRPNGSPSMIFGGENVAGGYATAAEAHAALCKDYSHYANIVNADYNAVGIGHVRHKGMDYWVEIFANTKTITSPEAAFDGNRRAQVEVDTDRVKKLPSPVSWEMNDEGTLRIYNSGKMDDFYAPWYSKCMEIQKIIIEDGVENIGNDVFSDCPNLKSVSIPNSVKQIGDYAFNNCSNLESVQMSSAVESIGALAFYNCKKLEAMVLPDTLTSIGNNGFNNCSSLKEIRIPSGITTIEDAVFLGCSGLTEVTLGQNVTSIGREAFFGCKGLRKIDLPASIESIGEEAFRQCRSLTSIRFPKNLTEIPQGICKECYSIKDIYYPEKCSSIGAYAFQYCAALTEISIPDTVSTIEEGAFNSCNNVKKVTIPNSVTEIGASAFADNYELVSVNIAGSVKTIGKDVFTRCYALKELNIGEGVQTIEANAFAQCPVETVHLPASCTALGSNAFSRYSIYDVAEGNPAYSSEEGVLFNFAKTVLIVYPSVKSCREYTIPNTVVGIADKAFYGSRSLTYIDIPDSVKEIGSGAFDGCANLTSIRIPKDITSISEDAFSFLNIPEIIIPGGVAQIGVRAFAFCGQAKSVFIPDSVETIGNNAFGGCSQLKDIYYQGTESQWREIHIGESNDALNNAVIHYGSDEKAIRLELKGTTLTADVCLANILEIGFVAASEDAPVIETPGRIRIVYTEQLNGKISCRTEKEGYYRAYVVYKTTTGESRTVYSDTIRIG